MYTEYSRSSLWSARKGGFFGRTEDVGTNGNIKRLGGRVIMRKLSKAKSRMLSFILSLCMVMASIIIASSPVEVNAGTINHHSTGYLYYIKNVRSGKFLTVQHNQFTAGQNIVQWKYTGENNQKWKLVYVDGYYKFYAYNTNYVLTMPSMSDTEGALVKLAVKNDNDDKQLFWSTNILSNGSYRFQTKASGCSRVLLANGASIYNNTYIVQGSTTTQWNDQWLLEVANNKNAEMSNDYANKNKLNRLTTYPDFDFYNGSDHQVNECINFASQCLTAGGYNYYKSDNDSNWWYINKCEHVTNNNFNFAELTSNWDISLSWYEPSDFQKFWVNKKSWIVREVDYSHLITSSNNTLVNEGIYCTKGSVIIAKDNTSTGYKARVAFFVKDKTKNGSYTLLNVPVCTHYKINGNNIEAVCSNSFLNAFLSCGFSNISNYKFTIIRPYNITT